MLNFAAKLADRGLDVSFEVARGQTVAILGPNGAGKSTVLNLLAGLLRADSGRAELSGRALFDTARHEWVPPHDRGVTMLAQEALLFPHLSALENVAFGPRSSGTRAKDARAAASTWLAEVDALELSSRKPAELSGGQAQRIAVARALASDPKLLLLDEPMAALDVTVAPALRRLLRRVLEQRTAIIVTHDVLDAWVLADRVIVMEGGRVVDSGPTRDVLDRPRTAFVAELAGVTLLAGSRTSKGMRTSSGVALLVPLEGTVGDAVGATIRPSSVTVSSQKAAGNSFRSAVLELVPHGDVIRVTGDLVSADVSPQVVAELDLAPGSPTWFTFPPEAVQVFDAR